MFGDERRPPDMLQGRSPSLDLDSLYGAGPQDPARRSSTRPTAAAEDGQDQAGGPPQAGVRPAAARRRSKAMIPDHRNDENLAVGQTHLAFIRFHNRVVKELASVPEASASRRAGWWSSTTSG